MKKVMSNYRFSLYLPEELEKKARQKAMSMGIIKGGVGNLSGYIRVLIVDDLHNKPDFKTNTIGTVKDATVNRVNITFPSVLREGVNDRAISLGFIRTVQGEVVGNITEYILYLLYSNLF